MPRLCGRRGVPAAFSVLPIPAAQTFADGGAARFRRDSRLTVGLRSMIMRGELRREPAATGRMTLGERKQQTYRISSFAIPTTVGI